MYREKTEAAYAFQMTAKAKQDPDKWPAWLHAAWELSPGTPGSLYPAHGGRPTGDLLLGMRLGLVTVATDDWIVRLSTGEMKTHNEQVFADKYEEVK